VPGGPVTFAILKDGEMVAAADTKTDDAGVAEANFDQEAANPVLGPRLREADQYRARFGHRVASLSTCRASETATFHLGT
jgi:hypothetical protein